MSPMSKNNSSKILYKRLRERFNYEQEDKIRKYVEGCNSLIGKLTNSVHHSHIALDLEHQEKLRYTALYDLKDKVDSLKDRAFFDRLGRLTGFD